MGTLMVEQVAHYRIKHKLGEGGMGVVYAAHDERLDRPVAIKMIRGGGGEGPAREQLWREARSAAAVNHPNVCRLYEVGESDGQLYLAMELLEGESVAARLARGPLAVAEATKVALGVLDALEPLHRRGIVHRDLKPSNIFLTSHGIKLLDFGVARPMTLDDTSDVNREDSGGLFGTPHYASPEQVAGVPVDGRSDLFALAVVLYELLSGRVPFSGRSVVETFHAILHQEPPPLGGSAAVASVDRVLRRAMAKKPDRRYATAETMATDLRAALLLADTSGAAAPAHALRRMIVLPFRILRPDPETDFLAFSLPDAITGSLSSLDSIVVRSTLTASRFAASASLQEIATQADVDIVLTGTLLRAGDQLRVTTQLAETADGALLWSQTAQVALGDIFQLQDSLTRRIVESLAVPLTVSDRRALDHNAPAHPKAYEFYLRANQLALESSEWTVAREMYLKCLELDPQFAPAWARLGRVYRALGQYENDRADLSYERAQLALDRALEIDPDLPIAHHLITNIEVDLGRALDATLRLLPRALAHPTDAALFAGLVQSCRYCGLLEPSIAAYEHAVRLDPDVRTSVNHSYLMRGEYDRSIETNVEDPPLINAFALDLAGRRDEAIALMLRMEQRAMPRIYKSFVETIRLLLEENFREARQRLDWMFQNFTVRDPCAMYYFGRELALAGEVSRALELLARSVNGGFSCFEFMARDPWLVSLRDAPEFRDLLRASEARERAARAAFIEAGGERVLNVRG